MIPKASNVADTGAVVSGSAWAVAYLGDLNALLTTAALVVAIISGGISIYRHFSSADKKQD